MRFARVGIILLVCELHGEVPLDNWHVRNPVPTANSLYDIAYGNKRFVAVSDRATVLVSSDGFAWLEYIGLTNLFYKITFGNEMFAASGPDGISTSVDGVVWTRRGTQRVEDLIYQNGRFVGVGGGLTVSSVDGLAWTTALIESPHYASLSGVTYGKGMFVAVGSEPVSDPESHVPPSPVVLISTNGTNWVSQTGVPLIYPFRVAFGNEVFVVTGALGKAWYSSDGVTWTESAQDPEGRSLGALAFAEGTFVATSVSRTSIYTSRDGRTWIPRNIRIASVLLSIIHAQGRFIAVGSHGGVIESWDGTNWVARSKGSEPELFNCTYGDGRFVAVGGAQYIGGFILTSDDGFSWEAQSFPADDYPHLGSIAYGNGMFVAAGNKGALYTCTNAPIWSPQNSRQTNWDFQEMTYAGGQFVALATDAFRNGGILTSSNGIDWKVRFTGVDHFLYGVAYGNGAYVAVGGDVLSVANPSIILTSADGSSWTRQNAGIPSTLTGVAYGNGRFVAVRYGGLTSEVVLTSPDGIVWTKQSLSSTSPLSGIVFGDGQFVAFGLNGSIFTSTYGVTWAPRNSNTRQDLWGATYGGGTFIAVGERGTVLQTAGRLPRLRPDATRLSDGVMRTIVESSKGLDFIMEGSSDLNTWIPIAAITNSPGLVELVDPAPMLLGKRFLRVRQNFP